MKKIVISCLLIGLQSSLFAQTALYDWLEERGLYEIDESLNDEALIYLKYHQEYDYIYEGANNDLIMYQTEHQIMKAGNDNALARTNRIYIPLRDAELVNLKARTITADGRSIIFDQAEMKEIEDEESGAGYKIFAIDGAEVGSEIEYFYTKRSDASYFGREFFQFSEPVLNASFSLTCPDNLEFDFKSYNGLSDVTFNKAEGTNKYTIVERDISPLKKEEFSAYDNSRKRLEFKLGYNQTTNRKLFRWTDATQLLYQRAFVISKDDKKLIEKLVGEVDLKKLKTEKLKISAIEDYIKTNFYLNENAAANGSDISFMIENRIGSKLGLTKLMINSIKSIGVEPQLVLTSDRNEIAFDGDFESYNYLQDYLIYLPGDQAFIAPYNPEYRYGMVPHTFTATKGLFIREELVDGLSIPHHEIQEIPALTAGENLDKMDVTVTFNSDLSSNTVHLKRSFNGYQAAFIKAVYPLIEEARKQELLKSLVKFLATDAEINTLALENSDFEYKTWDKPLVVDSEFESPSFIERAGDIILLKAGELIGPQTELYQENERKTRIQNEFNREYQRSIQITLPEGYQIENLDDLNFEEKVEENGEVIFYFKSFYTLDGNKLNIQVNEGYEEIYYPKEKFEAFRKVINAAADWNKIVLVMSKG